MFRTNVRKPIRKIWSSSEATKPSRPTTRLWLEALEDRTLPSASTVPVVATVSPEPAPATTAIMSDLLAMMNQRAELLAALQQSLVTVVNAVDQAIAQEEASIEQVVDSILGINPTASTPASNSTVSQPSSDKGKVQGSGSGSGSGTSSTASDGSPTPTSGVIKAQPLDGNGAPGDRYEWDPGVGYYIVYGSGGGGGGGSSTLINTPANLLASNPVNWLKNESIQSVPPGQQPTVPGNEAGDTVILGSSYAGSAGLQPIEWDHSFNFSTLSLTGYTAQETIDAGDTLELTGANNTGTSLTEDDNSNFTVNLRPNSKLTFDNSAGLGNFKITGDSSALVLINSGTTTIASKDSYAENLGVPLTINQGATLNDKSLSTLNLTANNVVITVKGEMDVTYGEWNANTLIQQAQNTTGCYVDVSGGTLKHTGLTGTKDTIAIPILVENNGTLAMDDGWLIVSGQNATTQKYSVYLKSGNVNLYETATLECDDDYRQDAGTLQTTDDSECSLQDGSTGGGTAVINGGTLEINGGASSGKLDVTANALNFAGTFIVGIQGNQTGQNGLLTVSKSMNLQSGSFLIVKLNGAVNNGQWTIIDTGGTTIADFGQASLPVGVTRHNNQPANGDYQVTAP